MNRLVLGQLCVWCVAAGTIPATAADGFAPTYRGVSTGATQSSPAYAPAQSPAAAAANPGSGVFRGAMPVQQNLVPVYRQSTVTEPVTDGAASGAAAADGTTADGATVVEEEAAETFEERARRQQMEQRREQLRKAWEEAHRPTAWQLQNPSGTQNRIPTEAFPSGPLAPNTYYGPQFRQWNQMSPPVYERTLPYNMQAVPPVTQTNVMLAPNTWWNSRNNRWNQITPGSASPSPLGGWNTRIGW